MTELRRFTYGDQFTPSKIDLVHLLELSIVKQRRRYDLQQSIRSAYFEGHGRNPDQSDENSAKMAMNCLLSLKAYGLINLTDGGKQYTVTPLTQELLGLKEDLEAFYRHFAVHILAEREGLLLCRLIENIRARGERVTLEYLGEEFNELGISDLGDEFLLDDEQPETIDELDQAVWQASQLAQLYQNDDLEA